jgi:predicted transcriptional regulator
MTRLLEKALEAVKELSREEQDEIARVILELIGSGIEEPVKLTDEERAAIARSMEQAERGEFATDAEIEAIWKKYA